MMMKLKPAIAEKAKEKQKTSAGGQNPQLKQNSAEAVNTRAELAKLANVSHDTVNKVENINRDAIEPVKELARER